MGELSDYIFKMIGGNYQYPQMPPNFPAFLVDAVLKVCAQHHQLEGIKLCTTDCKREMRGKKHGNNYLLNYKQQKFESQL